MTNKMKMTLAWIGVGVSSLGFISLLVAVSFFFGIWFAPVFIYNDTDDSIDVEPIVLWEGHPQDRARTPQLVIEPGQIESFTYDWDDTRFYGNVILNEQESQSSWCNEAEVELDEPVRAWSGFPLPIIPYETKKVYLWSDFEECELYSQPLRPSR